MIEHPVHKLIEKLSHHDQQIAEELAEQGFSDEDMYAALGSPGAVDLLKPKKDKQ